MSVNTARLTIKGKIDESVIDIKRAVSYELGVILLVFLHSKRYLLMLISTNQTTLKSESLGIPSVQLRKDEFIVYYSNVKLIE